jgi:hypothetical protein
MMGINSNYVRFTLDKAPDTASSTFDPITVTLSLSEATQRSTFNTALNAKRQRVIKWLLEKAKGMTASETGEVVSNVSKMEQAADALAGNFSKLSGVWKWEQMNLIFQPQGAVGQRDGRSVGRWAWQTESQKKFVVVFNGGKSPDTIFMVDTPSADKGNSVAAHRLSSGHLMVTRTPP